MLLQCIMVFHRTLNKILPWPYSYHTMKSPLTSKASPHIYTASLYRPPLQDLSFRSLSQTCEIHFHLKAFAFAVPSAWKSLPPIQLCRSSAETQSRPSAGSFFYYIALLLLHALICL